MLKSPAEYRRIWDRKRVLREIYSDMYHRILKKTVKGPILEVGGGSGAFKEFAPSTVSTDIIFAPWLALVCDAQRLPFADESFSNLVMVDVLHHIEHPVCSLREARRVLRPGGRMILCEPAITPLSRIAYRLFHDEPVDLCVDPLAEGCISPNKNPYDANQAVPTLLVGKYRQALSRAESNLELIWLDRFAFLAYPLSGGFRAWSALPAITVRPLLAIESRLERLLGRLAAFRLLAVYEKRG